LRRSNAAAIENGFSLLGKVNLYLVINPLVTRIIPPVALLARSSGGIITVSFLLQNSAL
jgi:hypothetical protein